mgnify:CR=1 FL=1|jgi:hypothetical protein|tara:strand:- start:168 stop:461 length:294 start_codon:yes stop_codon:yes gene_type:complete
MSNVTTLRRASTTFKNAIANSTADDIQDQLEILDELRKELSNRQTALRDAAITLGLARHDVSNREGAPNRAEYIKLHGLDAWDTNKKITSVRKFVWI